jgi:hypothetical protein
MEFRLNYVNQLLKFSVRTEKLLTATVHLSI